MFKKYRTLAVTAAVLTAIAATPAVADEMELDKTLGEVLAAHFETIGGEDAWRAIEQITMSGTMSLAQMGIEAPFTMRFKSPKMFRMEFVVQGMTGIQAYDGETVWQVMPFMGSTEPEALSGEIAEQMSEQADINPFLDWEDKGYQVELVGKEDVEGTEAYKVKLTRVSGNVRYYYLDSEYFLPFKVEGKTTFQGQEVESSTVLGDYKEVGDVVFAHSIEIQGGPAAPPQVLTIDSIDLATEIPATAFDMEAQKSTAEPTEG